MKNRRTIRFYLSAIALALSALLTLPATAGTLSGTYTVQTCTAGCAAGSATWLTNCAGTYSALIAGATTSVTNTNGGYTGSVTLTCNAGGAGTVAQSSATCSVFVNGSCGTSHNSDVSSPPATNLCTAGAASAVTGTGPYAWNCNGSSSGSNASCSAYKQCAAGAQPWLTNCTANTTLANHSATQSLTNTAGGYSGSATATCNATGTGAWALSGTSCAAAGACTLPWGGTTGSGTSVTAYLSATPAGACTSQSRTCTSGTLSGTYTAQTCTAGCIATSASWSGATTGCSGNYAALVAGGASSVTNVVAGKAGTVTVTCNAGGSGAVVQSSNVCTVNTTCLAGTLVSWAKLSNSCSGYSAADVANGASTTISSDNGNVGACTTTCTSGAFAACTTKSCIAGDGCFLGDVLVTMADGSTKPIAELEVGDKVRSGLNPNKINTITKLKSYTNRNLMYGINGSKAFVTAEHQFRGVDGTWKAIDPDLTYEETHGTMYPGKLMVGDRLVGENGTVVVVKSVTPTLMAPRTVYNPTLDGDHTYFANGYAVHNVKD